MHAYICACEGWWSVLFRIDACRHSYRRGCSIWHPSKDDTSTYYPVSTDMDGRSQAAVVSGCSFLARALCQYFVSHHLCTHRRYSLCDTRPPGPAADQISCNNKTSIVGVGVLPPFLSPPDPLSLSRGSMSLPVLVFPSCMSCFYPRFQKDFISIQDATGISSTEYGLLVGYGFSFFYVSHLTSPRALQPHADTHPSSP